MSSHVSIGTAAPPLSFDRLRLDQSLEGARIDRTECTVVRVGFVATPCGPATEASPILELALRDDLSVAGQNFVGG